MMNDSTFPILRQALVAGLLGAAMASASAQSVALLEPADGAAVSSPFKVRFGVTGMEVRPAGDASANTGHHHLLINADGIKAGEVVPTDATHLHFGKGQTETEVKLPPGSYKLTMQFANGAHQSYGPELSKSINITVE